jgi:hypothetical protein
MTAFDDDPEYEAQLKDVLGEQIYMWRDDGTDRQEGVSVEYVKDTDDQSEDGVLNDAPTFRMKVPREGNEVASKDENEQSITGNRDDKALSEDARSISTGDDSPSAQVP